MAMLVLGRVDVCSTEKTLKLYRWRIFDFHQFSDILASFWDILGVMIPFSCKTVPCMFRSLMANLSKKDPLLPLETYCIKDLHKSVLRTRSNTHKERNTTIRYNTLVDPCMVCLPTFFHKNQVQVNVDKYTSPMDPLGRCF